MHISEERRRLNPGKEAMKKGQGGVPGVGKYVLLRFGPIGKCNRNTSTGSFISWHCINNSVVVGQYVPET